MSDYIVTRGRIGIDGQVYGVGDRVSLDDEQAEWFLDREMLEAAKPTRKGSKASAEQDSKAAAPRRRGWTPGDDEDEGGEG
jgi:hypothetical protein